MKKLLILGFFLAMGWTLVLTITTVIAGLDNVIGARAANIDIERDVDQRTQLIRPRTHQQSLPAEEGNQPAEPSDGPSASGQAGITNQTQPQPQVSPTAQPDQRLRPQPAENAEEIQAPLNPTPPITFEFSQEPDNLIGAVSIQLEAQGAEKAILFRKQPQSLIENYIGTMHRAGPGEFSFLWLTTNTPNGQHLIFAKVTNQYGTYLSQEIVVTVNNTPRSIPEKSLREHVIQKAQQLYPPVTKPEKEKQAPQPQKRLPERVREQLEKQEAATREPAAPEAIERVEKGLEQALEQVTERPAAEEAQKRVQESEQKQQERIERLREFFSDLDQDGLTDADEQRFDTDPRNPDSDNDGILDGIEILDRTDPTTPGGLDQPIVFEQPIEKDTGTSNPIDLQVSEASIDPETRFITLTGKAYPNSFIVLYIYSSDPIIVTVKADANGNWTYTLDRELADGPHQVYVAITDSKGEILEKSEPLKFLKQATAVTVLAAEEQIAPTSLQVGLPQSEKASLDRLLLVVILVVASLILVLLIITLLAKQQLPQKK